MTKGLDEILSGEEPAQVETPIAPAPETVAPTPEPEAQPAPAEPNAPEPSAEERQSGMVPQKALHASRERARTAEERASDLERQLAEMNGKLTGLMSRPAPTPQPVIEPPKPVDFWEDPNKFIEQAISPLQAQLAQERFDRSVERNVATHGEETVKAAEAALRSAVESGQINGDSLKARLSQSRDPVGDIVRWHQEQPASVEARLRAEIEAKVRAELGVQEQPSTAPVAQIVNPEPTVMPSNLVGQRNVGTRSGPAWSGPASINDIFDRTRAKKAG
jgi:hypothetical protein